VPVRLVVWGDEAEFAVGLAAALRILARVDRPSGIGALALRQLVEELVEGRLEAAGRGLPAGQPAAIGIPEWVQTE